MADDVAEMGPVDYLVVEFPGSRMTGEGFPLLVDLVDRGLIRILDLVFVTKGEDGSVTAMQIADLDGDGKLDLAVFEGASSGLLDEDDLAEAGGVLEPGSSAGILDLRERVGGAVCRRPAARRWPAGRERPNPGASPPGGGGRRRVGFPDCLIGGGARARSLQRKEDTCQDFSVEWHGQLSSRVPRQRSPTGCPGARRAGGHNRSSSSSTRSHPRSTAAASAVPAAASAPAAPDTGDMIEQLKQLGELKERAC